MGTAKISLPLAITRLNIRFNYEALFFKAGKSNNEI